MQLYISEGAAWLLLVVYTPLVVLALWFFWRSLPNRLPIRIAGVLIAAFIAATIPLWDVVVTSTQMAALCSQAGITIKRTVNVDGFYTNIGSGDHLERGFEYVEVKSANRVKIYTKAGNEIQVQNVDVDRKPYVPKSRYEFLYGDTLPLAGYTNIALTRSVVLDRASSEELAYATQYTA